MPVNIVNVADSAALAALSPNGLTIGGTIAYNLDTQTTWELRVSNAALSSTVVAVSGLDGVRWIEFDCASLAALASTAVDSGATLVGVNNPAGRYDRASLQGVLDEDAVMKVDLAASDGTGGTSLVATENSGGYFSNTKELETFLQSAGSAVEALDASVTALLKPIEGATLTNADVTKNPASDNASQYILPPATLSANHALTLGVSGTPVSGTLVNVVRKDLTAHTYAVINGGTNGGTMITFASGPTSAQAATFFYNSVDWVFVGFQYVSVAQ